MNAVKQSVFLERVKTVKRSLIYGIKLRHRSTVVLSDPKAQIYAGLK